MKKDSKEVDILKQLKVVNAIDPLSIPDVNENNNRMIDINAMPTTDNSNKEEKSKLTLIIAAVGGVLLLICIIVLIVSNSGKKLTCTYSTDDEEKVEYKAVFKFDSDDNIKDFSIVMTADIANTDEYKNAEDKKSVIEKAKKQLEDVETYSSVNVSGTKFTISYKVDDVKKYGSNYDSVKKKMEKLKYTCK